MSSIYPGFTKIQWDFLSAIAAFDKPVPLDLIGKTVHIPHGQFLEMIRRCESLHWIVQDDNGNIGMAETLPEDIRQHLREIGASRRMAKIISRLKTGKPGDDASPEAGTRSFPEKHAHDGYAAVRNAMDMALDALKKCDRGLARKYIRQVVIELSSVGETLPENDWFIQTAIRFSEYCIVRSVGLSTVIKILEKVIAAANRVGDERSWTVANLLLGRTYWLQNKPNDALKYLGKGKEKAESLGDRDIMSYANLFIGLYHFLTGYHNEAAIYLKAVTQPAWQYEEYLLAYEAPILLSYSYINRCDFHQAVGTIDFFRQLAMKREDYYTASLYRAMLGITLRVSGKKEEALFHLEGCQADALAADNMIGYWIGLTGLSCLYFNEGNMEMGAALLDKACNVAKEAGVSHQIFHSIYLESYFNAEQAGCKLQSEWQFDNLFETIMAEPNINLQGVALRLKAMRSVAQGLDEEVILRDLQKSQYLLEKCQDSYQLAKTKAELIRFYLRKKDGETPRRLAQEVHSDVGANWTLVMPDDLGFLLIEPKMDNSVLPDYQNSLDPLLRMLEEMFCGPNNTGDMNLFLSTLSQHFRAERSGIFVFEGSRDRNPKLQTARNLSRSIVDDPSFVPSIDMIIASYRSRKPILSGGHADSSKYAYKGQSAMCLPLLHGKNVDRVLYFENSYLPNCFDFIEISALESLGRRLAGIIVERRNQKADEEPARLSKSLPWRENDVGAASDGFSIIAKDPKMIKLLKQSEKLAESEAPILILGETGVGKDVIAQWIHRNSPRRDKPFVIVDLTTIPENLMESELFGHEKGAFTGAHSQKIGRVELSEGGTLFFDEIGEIPIHLQVKLLRLLEMKSFMRVGGTKAKSSDFRLVAATNRNLFEEIKAGRFREDLYYRINTLELKVPPLRERRMDILALAEHFIELNSRKYGRKMLELTEQQKSAMKLYRWPGNVRELKNIIERAVLVAENDRLEIDFTDMQKSLPAENPFSDFPTLNEIQRRYIQFVLEHTGGKIGGKGGAAEVMGMKRTSLNSRMRKLKMR